MTYDPGSGAIAGGALIELSTVIANAVAVVAFALSGKLYVGGCQAPLSWKAVAPLDFALERVSYTGKLPFDVPSDMPSVMAQAADVPFDMVDPMFKFGFGLTYKR